jgi:hypothetical protein
MAWTRPWYHRFKWQQSSVISACFGQCLLHKIKVSHDRLHGLKQWKCWLHSAKYFVRGQLAFIHREKRVLMTRQSGKIGLCSGWKSGFGRVGSGRVDFQNYGRCSSGCTDKLAEHARGRGRGSMWALTDSPNSRARLAAIPCYETYIRLALSLVSQEIT